INRYGSYPRPGKYYVRIKNTKTGASDRSDKTFTVTPRSVDIKVNRSNGPVVLKNDQAIALSWSTNTDFTNCTIYGARTSLSEDTYQIDNVSTRGGSMRAYYHTREGEGASWISMACDKNGSDGRYDSVIVTLSGDVSGTGFGPSVSIRTPNGGETLRLGEPYEVSWQEKGISSYSIALYRNDQWMQWIAKDVPSGAEKASQGGIGSHQWTPPSPDSRLVGLGSVFKIYITGKRADGRGFVEDKSDQTFSFTASSTETTTPTTSTNPVKILSFTVSPSTVAFGGATGLAWTVDGPVATCALRTGRTLVADGLKASGTYELLVRETTTYSLHCNSSSTQSPVTSDVRDVVVTVGAREPAPSCSVSVSPSFIVAGQSVTLSWTSLYASSVILPGGAVGATSGSAVYTPKTTTTYTVTVVGTAEKATCSTTVALIPLPIPSTTSPTPAPTPTGGSIQEIRNKGGILQQVSRQLSATTIEAGVTLNLILTRLFGF
ncbi:MAG: hypothetical protein WBK28_00720, partial [Minisyncoccia bacterium]